MNVEIYETFKKSYEQQRQIRKIFIENKKETTKYKVIKTKKNYKNSKYI